MLDIFFFWNTFLQAFFPKRVYEKQQKYRNNFHRSKNDNEYYSLRIRSINNLKKNIYINFKCTFLFFEMCYAPIISGKIEVN